MNYELIDERDAPKPPKALSKSARAALEVIKSLKPGKVARVTPQDNQSVRGIKTSLSRVATNNEKKVEVWSIDEVVYIKLAK